MKRRLSALPVLCYKYGVLAPTTNKALVHDQMRLAHRYQMDLVASILKYRNEYREFRRAHLGLGEAEDRYAEAAAAAQKARNAVSEYKTKHRTAKVPADITTAYKEAKLVAATALAESKRIRTAVDAHPDVVAFSKEQNTRLLEDQRALRKACGCYSGTYLLVEAAASQQRSSTADPKFRRFTGEGRVGVQLPYGVTVAKMFTGTDTRIRCSTPNDRGYAVLSMRVASENRSPLWADFPIKFHRPLPPDGLIKWATVQMRRIGTREKWDAVFTIEAQSLVVTPRVDYSTAAINFGWRQLPHGTRVGMLVDSDGRQQELLVPERTLRAIEHGRSLQSIRDREMAPAKAAIAAWMDTADLPEWMRESHVRKWESQGRLRQFVERWRNNRVSGDDEAFSVAIAWFHQDKHLFQWQASEVQRAYNHRQHVYREIAASLARRYGTILVFDANIKDLAETPDVDATEYHNKSASDMRGRAAPAELRMAVKQAGGRYGASVVTVPSAYTTKTCHRCGTRVKGAGLKNAVDYTCEHCGVTWDQDVNAAKNMLAWYQTPDAKAAE